MTCCPGAWNKLVPSLYAHICRQSDHDHLHHAGSEAAEGSLLGTPHVPEARGQLFLALSPTCCMQMDWSWRQTPTKSPTSQLHITIGPFSGPLCRPCLESRTIAHPCNFLAMTGGIIKSRRTRRPRPRDPPNFLLQKLLDTVVVGDGIGMQCPRFT